MNKHVIANEYKVLCSQADKVINNKYKKEDLPKDWEVVEKRYDKRSNFKAVLYEKDGHYALCFVGTDKKSLKDWGANAKMATSGGSKQIQEAENFASDMIDAYGLTEANTVSIGHSEGGTEATVVGVKFGLKTTTYNAYGIMPNKYEDNTNNYKLVTNYRDPHDPVSKLRENVGETYIVPNTQNKFMSNTPFGMVQAHVIDKMGNCEQAVSKEEYKKSNKWFIDKISDADISREDIKDMDSKLYSVYENVIDKKMANNEIKQKSSYKNANNTNSSDGKWVTINGNHVLIEK